MYVSSEVNECHTNIEPFGEIYQPHRCRNFPFNMSVICVVFVAGHLTQLWHYHLIVWNPRWEGYVLDCTDLNLKFSVYMYRYSHISHNIIVLRLYKLIRLPYRYQIFECYWNTEFNYPLIMESTTSNTPVSISAFTISKHDSASWRWDLSRLIINSP